MNMFILFLCFGLSLCAEEPVADTKYGEIHGFRVKTASGGEADIFLGIPFAEPPLGDLRLEKPVPISPWETPLNATYWRHECVPHTKRAIINEVNEDCLHLNIIRPVKKPPVEGFPVLFWIHGGGFQFGSARRHGYQGFADSYAHRDVIIVSIQYRLGILGFLSNGEDDLPGNLGLWDMQLALKMTREIIGDFGGNPDKITLWGLSAGAGAVGQLMVSPHTRDYAAGGIEHSGSAWSSWSLGHQVVDFSKELIKALGCTDSPKDCMKKKTIDEIDEAVEAVGYATDDLLIAKWGPRIDGDFLPAHPSVLAKDTQPKPLLTGVGNKDVAFFTLMKMSTVIHNLTITNLEHFGEKEFKERVSQLMVDSTEFGSHEEDVLKEVISYYLESDGKPKDNAFYINKYNEFVGDLTFNLPMIDGVEARQKAGWPVYLYSFEQFNEAIWKNKAPDAPKETWGSVHVNEFTYIYGQKLLASFEDTDGDVQAKENLRNCLVEFARTGKATWGEAEWPLAGEELQYLALKEKPEIHKNYFRESTEFWRRLNRYGYDAIQLTKYSAHDEL